MNSDYSSDQIFNFIVNSLKLAGAPYQIINGNLIMAQCQVNVPRSFFTPARVETQNLQLVCEAQLVDRYPGSEWVTPGSYRLQWLVNGIKERGSIFKGSSPYDLDYRKVEREINRLLPQPRPDFFYRQPILSYHPHLLVNFKASFETDERQEELASLSINLNSGEINTQLLTKLAGKKISSQLPPKKLLLQKKIPYSEGFQALENHLRWKLQNHNSAWIEAAKQRWRRELACLEAYYNESDPAQSDEAGFYRQAAETYLKFRPKIKTEIINLALLYLPQVDYTVEAWGSSQQLPPILYDPIFQEIKWQVLEPSTT